MKFKKILDDFLNSTSEDNMLRVISYVESRKVHDEEIALLAEGLADSGERLIFNDKIQSADIPSTGGPSSLTTVLCPLYLANFGYSVPKLSVPGSPAGGIDILGQIPGYKIHFTKQEFESLLAKHKYIHCLADKVFCPLDIAFFKFRKKNHKLNVFPLVIASLLSKKIALGVKNVGLDIRISPKGNFGHSFDEAKENANRFNKVAKLLNISSKCFLTDVRFPQQPYIGRGEALLALYEIFENGNVNIGANHLGLCYSMARSLVSGKVKEFSTINLKKVFEENLFAQGSSYKKFLLKVNEIKNEETVILKANTDGFLNINLQSIKEGIIKGQSVLSSPDNEFPDSCGCTFMKNQNDFVRKNEPILALRAGVKVRNSILHIIKNSFSVSKIITLSSHYEEITL